MPSNWTTLLVGGVCPLFRVFFVHVSEARCRHLERSPILELYIHVHIRTCRTFLHSGREQIGQNNQKN